MQITNTPSLPEPALEEIINFIKSSQAASDAEEQAAAEEQQWLFTAALIMSVSLVLGFIGNWLFYSNELGINIFLYVALFSLTAFGLLIEGRASIVRKHAVFIIPALLAALLLGVRTAPQLVRFNTAMLCGSLLIVIRFIKIERFMGGHWLELVVHGLDIVFFGWFDSLRSVVPDGLRWFGQRTLDHRQTTNVSSALRGVLFALPVVALFTILLSAADAVFSNFATQFLTFVLPENIVSIISQTFWVAMFSTMSLTALWIMVGRQTETKISPQKVAHSKSSRFNLNIIESSIVLGSVNLLFVAFVLIQARYFFGGEANINLQGFTYAAYARRGFYELLSVSFMTMLLLVALEGVTYRKREEENTFRGLVILMVGLTFVILIAAFQRLNLYENAYGYTQIRVMSGTFMLWLAVLLGILLVAILRHQHQLFWIGCVATGLGFVFMLNVMNMDGFITQHNIERFNDTDKLDLDYLFTLSDDAVPAMATLLKNTSLDENDMERLKRELGWRLHNLDRDREQRDITDYHIGKARAWRVLDENRADLLFP